MATTPIGHELDEVLTWLWDELHQVGRSRVDFGLEGRISLARGDEDSWKREYAFWQSVGATHVSLETLGGVYGTVTHHLNALERGLRVIESM